MIAPKVPKPTPPESQCGVPMLRIHLWWPLHVHDSAGICDLWYIWIVCMHNSWQNKTVPAADHTEYPCRNAHAQMANLCHVRLPFACTEPFTNARHAGCLQCDIVIPPSSHELGDICVSMSCLSPKLVLDPHRHQ